MKCMFVCLFSGFRDGKGLEPRSCWFHWINIVSEPEVKLYILNIRIKTYYCEEKAQGLQVELFSACTPHTAKKAQRHISNPHGRDFERNQWEFQSCQCYEKWGACAVMSGTHAQENPTISWFDSVGQMDREAQQLEHVDGFQVCECLGSSLWPCRKSPRWKLYGESHAVWWSFKSTTERNVCLEAMKTRHLIPLEDS